MTKSKKLNIGDIFSIELDSDEYAFGRLKLYMVML